MDVPFSTSEPSVCLACAPVRKTALERKWSAPTSSALTASAWAQSVSLMIVVYSRNGSSGFRILVNSKSDPSSGGDQRLFFFPYTVLPAEPWTISVAAKRLRGAAAVFRKGVRAGTIDSIKGSAIVAPIPCNTVRRERCFFVMNMDQALLVLPYRDTRTHWSSASPEAEWNVLIWNGALFTTPRTNDEKRLSRAAAAR